MRRFVVTLGAALATGALLFGAGGASEGCAYDWSYTPDGEPTDDAGGLDSAQRDAARDAPIEPNEAAPPPPPPPQSCKPGVACLPSQYCKYPDHLCGMGQSGTCTPIPNTCTTNEWVCGCGGQFAKDPCSLATINVDVAVKGTCVAEPPADFFPCGYRFCLAKIEYCLVDLSPVAGGVDEYTCVSLKSCSPASCSCPSIPQTNCVCMELDPTRSYRVECKK